MGEINNPILKKVNDLYLEYEKHGLSSQVGQDYLDSLYDEAWMLFDTHSSEFLVQDLIEAFLFGTELLQRNSSGLMISDKYFHPKYLEVMIQSVKKDTFVSNYKFIFTLQKNLSRTELIDLMKGSLHSDSGKVQFNSLIVVNEELLHELYSDVEKLSSLPDLELSEIEIPTHIADDPAAVNAYISYRNISRDQLRNYAKKTLKVLKE